MFPHTRVLLISLVSALLLLGNVLVASADVVSNTFVTLGPFTMFNNPCDPADGPLTVTVTEHRLVRVEPDGTVVTHVNTLQGTAVSANGTDYQIIRTATIAAPAGGLVVTDIFVRRISHGGGDNAMIVISGIGTTTMTATLRWVGPDGTRRRGALGRGATCDRDARARTRRRLQPGAPPQAARGRG